MGIANWLRSFRRKEIESVSEECVHHWHNVGERYEEYFGKDVHDYRLSRVVEYYCPRCSDTKRIERDYAETFEKKARLRREYYIMKEEEVSRLKVYVLYTEYLYGGGYISGVFSSVDSALQAKERLGRAFGKRYVKEITLDEFSHYLIEID